MINGDAASLRHELARRGIGQCDYILSGIPFSILQIDKKMALLQQTYDALAPGGSFIIYQVTNELKQHASTIFDKAESEYFLQNIPPMFVTVFRKTVRKPLNGNGAVEYSRYLLPSARMTAGGTRIEKDSMGEMSVPESALYGASTQRAVLNFPD